MVQLRNLAKTPGAASHFFCTKSDHNQMYHALKRHQCSVASTEGHITCKWQAADLSAASLLLWPLSRIGSCPLSVGGMHRRIKW